MATTPKNDQGHILCLEVENKTWSIGSILNHKGSNMMSTLWKEENYNKNFL